MSMAQQVKGHNMIVYGVFIVEDYENDDLQSLHATMELAKKKAIELDEEHHGLYNFEVRDWEVKGA